MHLWNIAAFRCGVFERLFQAVEITKFNREEMDAYDRAVFAEMDRQNILQTARNEGIAYGREAGIAVGLAEGLQKGSLIIAKNLKTMGIDSEVISRSTGLTIEQVKAL